MPKSRTRFLGYRVENYKLFVFTLSACMAGVAGALYVPQVGIINPSEFAPGKLDRGGDLGRGRRPRHADRRRASVRVVVNYGKTNFTMRPARAVLAVPARRAVRRWSRCCCRAASSAPFSHYRGRAARAPRGRPRTTTACGRRAAHRSRRSERHGPIAPHPRCSISTASRSRSTASGRSTTCRSPSSRARCAPSSARTAPARPR